MLAEFTHGFETLDLTLIVAGHGVDYDNFRKLLHRTVFKYTQNILGPETDQGMHVVDHRRQLAQEEWGRLNALLSATLGKS